MSTLPKEPEQPITAKQVEAWLHTAQRKRLTLHVQAMVPWNSLPRQQAFMEMSNLLQEALKEVRVISTTLREDSQALRAHTGRGAGACRATQGTATLDEEYWPALQGDKRRSSVSHRVQ